MKKLFVVFLFIPFILKAQVKPLIAEGVSPHLFITHKVAAKENLYSIGRIYNISPRDIAPFNNIKLEDGLNLGQVIRIPLNSSNFFQRGTADADEVFVPVYHIVNTKEGLYRVSQNFDKLPLESLKKWNNIKGESVKNGSKLIVGYLKVKKELSSLAKNEKLITIDANDVAAVKTETKEAGPEVKKTEETAEKVKPEKTESNNAKPFTAVAQETTKTEKNEPAVKEIKATPRESSANSNMDKNAVGGVFKSIYDVQNDNATLVNEEGTAGIFKSTSGWSDKKYYCLYNNANPGTIIKISNPANGKYVFAKVLDQMPDLKQNNGLLICISSAAADALASENNTLTCSINYSK